MRYGAVEHFGTFVGILRGRRFDSSVLAETYTLTREASPALFAVTMGTFLQYSYHSQG